MPHTATEPMVNGKATVEISSSYFATVAEKMPWAAVHFGGFERVAERVSIENTRMWYVLILPGYVPGYVRHLSTYCRPGQDCPGAH